MEETLEEQIQRCLKEMVEEGKVEVSIGEKGELLYSLSEDTTFTFEE